MVSSASAARVVGPPAGIEEPSLEVIEPIIQRVLATKVGRRRFKARLTKRGLIKVIYLVREGLPASHPLRSAIPYYWYYYGPYTPFIPQALEEMKDAGLVKHEDRLYSLPSGAEASAPPWRSAQVEILQKVMNQVLSRINPFNIEEIVEEIYWNMAPEPFCTEFKLRFMRLVNNFCNEIDNSQTTLGDFGGPLKDTRHLIINNFYKCESLLPSYPDYKQFNSSFSTFGTALQSLINWRVSDSTPEFISFFKEFNVHTDPIWKAFAEGLRVHHHDPYYEEIIEKWSQQFHSSSLSLSRDMEQLFDLVIERVEFPEVQTDPEMSHTLSAFLDGYYEGITH